MGEKQIIGIAHDLSPYYNHILRKYKKVHPHTKLGNQDKTRRNWNTLIRANPQKAMKPQALEPSTYVSMN